jgi:hypothetical protein
MLFREHQLLQSSVYLNLNCFISNKYAEHKWSELIVDWLEYGSGG